MVRVWCARAHFISINDRDSQKNGHASSQSNSICIRRYGDDDDVLHTSFKIVDKFIEKECSEYRDVVTSVFSV